MDFLREKIEGIPELPGVYIFKGDGGEVLYVGKAINLRNRLRSYLREEASPRLRALRQRARDVEIVVTRSEDEALLLEANFIKMLKPRYNIKLRDDKKYPFIKITVREPYPRIFLTRDIRNDGSIIVGPYAHARIVRKVLRLVRDLFPIRGCKYKLPTKRKISPCIDYFIGKCIGPCFRDVPQEEYRALVQGVVDFLTGRTEAVERRLEEEMRKAAQALEFEKAAKLRDQLRAVRAMIPGSEIAGIEGENRDFVAIRRLGGTALAFILKVRSGKAVDREDFVLDTPQEADDSEVLSSFLTQYYTSSTLTVTSIVVENLPDEREALERILERRVGRQIKIRSPKSEEKKLMEIAIMNAEKLLEEEISLKGVKGRVHPALEELRELFSLDRVPIRIEAVDISQLFGKNAVGSIVVFDNGRPKKSQYRKYRIKGVKGIDDYRMMEEVLKRRFRRLKEEGELPDLLLVDGGRGQLNIALSVMKDIGIDGVYALGIAKRFDELHLPDGRVVMLPRRSHALRLLQRIRDEAHRFAITYHRKLRKKEALKSALDFIPGIGESKKKALMEYFGSVRRLMGASKDEIERVKGIGPVLADRIFKALHGE